MPKKTTTSFAALLQAIIDLTDGTRPKEIVTDFEPAMVIAVRRVLPATRHRGCLFSFQQTCAMQIKMDGAMTRAYNSSPRFKSQINELMALALVPPEHVVKAFDILKQMLLRDEATTRFAKYFERSFIGRFWSHAPETRKDPIFPISMWNYNNSARDQSTKNNDAMKNSYYLSGNQFDFDPPLPSDFFRLLKRYQIVHTKKEIEKAGRFVGKCRGRVVERLSQAVKAFPETDHERCLTKHICRLSHSLPSLKRHIVPRDRWGMWGIHM
jgi:hypothetical protein